MMYQPPIPQPLITTLRFFKLKPNHKKYNYPDEENRKLNNILLPSGYQQEEEDTEEIKTESSQDAASEIVLVNDEGNDVYSNDMDGNDMDSNENCYQLLPNGKDVMVWFDMLLWNTKIVNHRFGSNRVLEYKIGTHIYDKISSQWFGASDIWQITQESIMEQTELKQKALQDIQCKMDSFNRPGIIINSSMQATEILKRIRIFVRTLNGLVKRRDRIDLNKMYEVHQKYLIKHQQTGTITRLEECNPSQLMLFFGIEFCGASSISNRECLICDPDTRCVNCGMWYHEKCFQHCNNSNLNTNLCTHCCTL